MTKKDDGNGVWRDCGRGEVCGGADRDAARPLERPARRRLRERRPARSWGAAPTNDGLTMVVVGWPYPEAPAYKADVEANYLRRLDSAPEFADRVRASTREDRFTGGGVPNFFRRPFGPGWALVGDAGYTRDPITAQGITDAFRDAELCAAAIDEAFGGRRSFDEAMTAYQQTRDAQVTPIYEFTTQLASLEPPPPEMQQLLGAIYGNQEAMDGFASVAAGTVSPAEYFAPENVGRIMGQAAGMQGPQAGVGERTRHEVA